MNKELDVTQATWIILLSLSGTILLAPLFPEILDEKTAHDVLTGKEGQD